MSPDGVRKRSGDSAGGADRVDRGPREEEAQHELGPDALDRVAVDQRVVAECDAVLGTGPDRQPDIADVQELARRPGQGATRIEATCGKCGGKNRVSATKGESRVEFTCKECGHKQKSL